VAIDAIGEGMLQRNLRTGIAEEHRLCKMTWKKLSTQEDFLSISAKVIDFVLA
jgi:hypothetical protein